MPLQSAEKPKEETKKVENRELVLKAEEGYMKIMEGIKIIAVVNPPFKAEAEIMFKALQEMRKQK